MICALESEITIILLSATLLPVNYGTNVNIVINEPHVCAIERQNLLAA